MMVVVVVVVAITIVAIASVLRRLDLRNVVGSQPMLSTGDGLEQVAIARRPGTGSAIAGVAIAMPPINAAAAAPVMKVDLRFISLLLLGRSTRSK